MRRRAIVIAWAALAASTAALAQTASASVQREWRIVQGNLPADQRLLKVAKGDSVVLRIGSDMPGAVHLHAYRLVATIEPGQVTELRFKAHATGRFRLEWHPAGAPAGDPAGAHHAPPVAVLEVRPP